MKLRFSPFLWSILIILFLEVAFPSAVLVFPRPEFLGFTPPEKNTFPSYCGVRNGEGSNCQYKNTDLGPNWFFNSLVSNSGLSPIYTFTFKDPCTPEPFVVWKFKSSFFCAFSLLVFMSSICPLPFQLPISRCCCFYLLSRSLCSWWSMPLKKPLFFYFGIILGGSGNHKCPVHQLAESPCLPLNCDINMRSFSKSLIWRKLRALEIRFVTKIC